MTALNSTVGFVPWSVVRHRELIWQFIRRDLRERYRSSALGMLWTLITPLAMLAVYTLVFGVIFKSRWPDSHSNSILDFSLTLFTGLVAFGVFADVANRAPGLVVGQINLVKKVVFPLETLVASGVGAAVARSLIELIIVLAGLLIAGQGLHWTMVFLPLYYLPLIFLCLGIGWFLSALGVFLRDINHVVGVVVQLLLFLTPVFYSIDLFKPFPPLARDLVAANPLHIIIDGFRRCLVWGRTPDWWPLAAVTGFGLLVMLAGHWWFAKLKRAFADVI